MPVVLYVRTSTDLTDEVIELLNSKKEGVEEAEDAQPNPPEEGAEAPAPEADPATQPE